MTMLFMEGFTGIPRGQSNFVAGNPLESLGWKISGLYNGSNPVAADGNVVSVIEADTTFGSRNQLSLNKTGAGAVSSYLHQILQPLDTSGFEKFVIGGMFMTTTADTSASPSIICIGDATQWPSTSSSYPLATIMCQIHVPNNGTDGAIMNGSGGNLQTTALLKKGKWTHFEILAEQDVDRLRVYLDGVLSLDITWTGTLTGAASGLGITVLRQAAITGPDTNKFSNLYMFGVDALTPGIVGPAARVLEVAPPNDKAVQFTRPTSYASNAAVLGQMFNASTSDYLTAGDPSTDLYGGIDAVAANAAKVYGAMMRVSAMSMAEGTHTIAGAVRSGSTDLVSPKALPLTLGVMKSFAMDVSKNPATNLPWTPAEITAAGIGFRLVQ